jgi:hypothetical protein
MTTTSRTFARASATFVGLVAAALLLGAPASSASSAQTVKVWFLQGEQMIAVERPGATVEDGVRQLLAGPTQAELKRGYRTYVPKGTRLRSASVQNGTAVVDLSLAFVKGRDPSSLRARLSELVHTATGPEGATKVKLLVEGGVPLGMFPGVFVAGPITVSYLETPDTSVPKPPSGTSSPVLGTVRAAQQRLVELGYLLSKDVDGQAGPTTQSAVLAFQKWEGLQRDGALGLQTLKRLQVATRPAPRTRGGSGRRAEVLLDRQVALAIEDDELVRVIHVSTGKGSTPTPPGDYKVYAKIAKWWSVPFREWLLWAVPFNGGIAFHEFPEVPAYAASHGCVRNQHATARWMYEFSRVGMPVKVITSSR